MQTSKILSHTEIRLAVVVALIAVYIFGGPLTARAAVPTARPFVSPEVHSDRTVTFRVLAPKASEVNVVGGWMPPGQSVPLIKDSSGLWSLTVGPLPPTVYAYWFVVDGADFMDEGNQYVRIRTGGTSLSMVEVPGDTQAAWAVRNVPHGSVEMNRVLSEAHSETRNVWVYLPPGYEKNTSTRYPILYLLHGAGEMQLSWRESGKADLILDNLLADGKAKPMIVVMPYTGPTVAAQLAGGRGGGRAGGRGTSGGTGAAPGAGPAPSNTNVDYIVKEIMPWAEGRYRVAAGRGNRAVAGFSAGGSLAGSIGLGNLELFSHLGLFSAPLQGFNTRFPAAAADPKGTNAKLSVFWIGVGKEDPLATEGLRKFDAELTKGQIKHTYMETEGAHDFSVWRWCLVQFAPLLFRS